MSWQAMEAVQDNSKQEPGSGLAIMYAIARSADAAGVVGAGGKTTAPNIETIADRAHCSKGTVLNWLPKLEESGELKVERFGKGRGKWNRYTILLPMPEEEPAPAQPGEPTVNERLDRLEETVQKLAETVQAGLEAIQETVQETVQNGTSHVVLDTKDTNTPPTPPKKPETPSAGESEEGEGEEKPDIEDLAEYFCQITGRKMPRKYSSDYARQLWWEPLAEIYNQHGDFRETKRAMYGAVQYANDAGLTIATPKSLINLAVAGKRDHSGYRNSDGVLVVSRR